MFAVRLTPDFGSMQRIHMFEHLEADIFEAWQRPIMREYPAPMAEWVCVLHTDRSNRCATHMCHRGVRIDPCGRFREVFAFEGGPSLLLDDGHTVGIVRNAPAMAMH